LVDAAVLNGSQTFANFLDVDGSLCLRAGLAANPGNWLDELQRCRVHAKPLEVGAFETHADKRPSKPTLSIT
jgi:hypothetical protein